MSRSRFLTAAGALLVAGAPRKARATSAKRGGMKRSWIMSAGTFEGAVGTDPALAKKMFGSTCYVPGYGESYGLRRVHSHYVRNYLWIQDRIDEGTLKAGDNIVWAIETGENSSDPNDVTPPEQYANGALGPTLRAARNICHSVGATLIAAPAGNIMDVIAPEYHGSTTEAQLAYHIPDICARNADMYEIQKQQALQQLANYTKNVTLLAERSRQVAPETPVLAGVTTNSTFASPDDYPTAQEIAAAMLAVRSVVDGFWLNVPAHRQSGVHDIETARRALRIYYGISPMK